MFECCPLREINDVLSQEFLFYNTIIAVQSIWGLHLTSIRKPKLMQDVAACLVNGVSDCKDIQPVLHALHGLSESFQFDLPPKRPSLSPYSTSTVEINRGLQRGAPWYKWGGWWQGIDCKGPTAMELASLLWSDIAFLGLLQGSSFFPGIWKEKVNCSN